MHKIPPTSALTRLSGLLRRLARNRAGNTIMLVAAAIAPIMAMVGGGVDMGRSYLSQSRLQQACDAGVLAARKKLGTEVTITGDVPDEVAEVGQRFFNINFRTGSYGTEDRTFEMQLNEDYSISGTATVNVPTTIMRAFGFTEVPIEVNCEAQLNMSDTDVMMVLDVTGSMSDTNPGDTMSKIDALKETVRNFHAQMTASVSGGTRVRFGFVPYSTNVNVGGLLEDDWVVDEWTYQSRERVIDTSTETTRTYWTNWTYKSGSASTTNVSSYAATYHPPTSGHGEGSASGDGYYTCDTSAPSDAYTSNDVLLSTVTEPFVGPPVGTRTTEHYRRTINGDDYWIQRIDNICYVKKTTYSSYVEEYDKVTEPTILITYKWKYHPIAMDVSDWRTTSNGCMEERDTYDIDDYSNVDLSRALDLDIDRVPTAGTPATQWRPMFPGIIFEREIYIDSLGNVAGGFKDAVSNTTATWLNAESSGVAACPPAAKKLSVMTSGEIDSYLATLSPDGNTYHDIGMIWGGRLLSPTGIFASENSDAANGREISRHMIFLTDGQTATLDLSYGTYGVEPLDERRWKDGPGGSGSSFTLTETVENRFAYACEEVKKKNITVWVIAFGTSLNPIMTNCAGEGHYFAAADADELSATFATIAEQLGELRVTR
ncbi:MAG: TadE/TadG family protein [Novosphingobium sp.]